MTDAEKYTPLQKKNTKLVQVLITTKRKLAHTSTEKEVANMERIAKTHILHPENKGCTPKREIKTRKINL